MQILLAVFLVVVGGHSRGGLRCYMYLWALHSQHMHWAGVAHRCAVGASCMKVYTSACK